MVIGTLRILPTPGRRHEVLEVLRSVQGLVLAQPGCASCRILEEQGPDDAIVLLERWDTPAALTTHLRSEAYRRVLGACELSAAPPEFRFDEVVSTHGIELVERTLAASAIPERSGEDHRGSPLDPPQHRMAGERPITRPRTRPERTRT